MAYIILEFCGKIGTTATTYAQRIKKLSILDTAGATLPFTILSAYEELTTGGLDRTSAVKQGETGGIIDMIGAGSYRIHDSDMSRLAIQVDSDSIGTIRLEGSSASDFPRVINTYIYDGGAEFLLDGAYSATFMRSNVGLFLVNRLVFNSEADYTAKAGVFDIDMTVCAKFAIKNDGGTFVYDTFGELKPITDITIEGKLSLSGLNDKRTRFTLATQPTATKELTVPLDTNKALTDLCYELEVL